MGQRQEGSKFTTLLLPEGIGNFELGILVHQNVLVKKASNSWGRVWPPKHSNDTRGSHHHPHSQLLSAVTCRQLSSSQYLALATLISPVLQKRKRRFRKGIWCDYSHQGFSASCVARAPQYTGHAMPSLILTLRLPGRLTSSISQVRKLRLREVKELSQCHTAGGKWQSQNSNPGPPYSPGSPGGPRGRHSARTPSLWKAGIQRHGGGTNI